MCWGMNQRRKRAQTCVPNTSARAASGTGPSSPTPGNAGRQSPGGTSPTAIGFASTISAPERTAWDYYVQMLLRPRRDLIQPQAGASAAGACAVAGFFGFRLPEQTAKFGQFAPNLPLTDAQAIEAIIQTAPLTGLPPASNATPTWLASPSIRSGGRSEPRPPGRCPTPA